MNLLITISAIVLPVLLTLAVIFQGIESLVNIVEKLQQRFTRRGKEKRVTNVEAVKPDNGEVQLTQAKVASMLFWLQYGPLAVAISYGAHRLTTLMESDWAKWLLSAAIIGVVWLSPSQARRTSREGHPRGPIYISWLLAISFGALGLILVLNPSLVQSYRLAIIISYSVLVVALQSALIWHIMVTSFDPWFDKLPKT